jgi:Raf kinase inhibitor-like YbhB/YbcL family protein
VQPERGGLKQMKQLVWLTLTNFGIPLFFILLTVVKLVYAQKSDDSFLNGIPKTIHIWSSAFEDNGIIPGKYCCVSKQISTIPLNWDSVPQNVRSLVIIASDFDIPDPQIRLFEFVHWIIYNIPVTTGSIPPAKELSSVNVARAVIGKNGFGKRAYYPPCPLHGEHSYVFRIFALDCPGIKVKNPIEREILKEIKSHIVAYGEMTGKFRK